MIPVIAIVGRPNVGKSTLFNQLTRSREALVYDSPGVTRDRQYGEGRVGTRPFIVIDTGGLEGGQEPESKKKIKTESKKITQVSDKMMEQSWLAVSEADAVLFLVDAKAGLTPEDSFIANRLRHFQPKPIYLVVNKTDGMDTEIAMTDFYSVGLGNPLPISASHGQGVVQLIEQAIQSFPETEAVPEELDKQGIKIAIVGRPNVGKSTLVNRMLGEERVIVFDEPGTTRDSIYIPLERYGQNYTIIDTAGVRRRARISEVVEKFSVVKTLKAIEDCHVAILIMDASFDITDQDLGLLEFVIEAGKALVIAFNKWDGLSEEQKNLIKKKFKYKLNFVEFAKVHYISALHGTNVGHLFESVQRAYQSAGKKLTTPMLTRLLEKGTALHNPPMIRGRRIKLRYAHAGGHFPPLIIIHGNQTESVPSSYKRYLMKFFTKELKLEGTPIRIVFKTGENPYKEAGQRKKRLTGYRKRKTL